MQPNPFDRGCPTRQILDRIGDQWTVLIILVLSGGPLRFTEIGNRVGGISQKMLTQTLRELEQHGLIRRHDHHEVPPRVEYSLTPLGSSLAKAIAVLDDWVIRHYDEIERATRRSR